MWSLRKDRASLIKKWENHENSLKRQNQIPDFKYMTKRSSLDISREGQREERILCGRRVHTTLTGRWRHELVSVGGKAAPHARLLRV